MMLQKLCAQKQARLLPNSFQRRPKVIFKENSSVYLFDTASTLFLHPTRIFSTKSIDKDKNENKDSGYDLNELLHHVLDLQVSKKLESAQKGSGKTQQRPSSYQKPQQEYKNHAINQTFNVAKEPQIQQEKSVSQQSAQTVQVVTLLENIDLSQQMAEKPTATSKREKIPTETNLEDQLLDKLLQSDVVPQTNKPALPLRRVIPIINRKARTKKESPSFGEFKDMDDDYDEERVPRNKDDEDNMIFGVQSGQKNSTMADVLERLRQNSLSMMDEWSKEVEIQILGDKVVMERCRKALKKRWKNLANLKKARKAKRGPKQNIARGTISPEFKEGFGVHFVPAMKRIPKNHKLMPVMEFYSRKLANNGTLTYDQKFRGMKFLMRYLGRKLPQGFKPGISDILLPMGCKITEQDNPHDVKKAFVEANFFLGMKKKQKQAFQKEFNLLTQKKFTEEEEEDVQSDLDEGDSIFQDEEEVRPPPRKPANKTQSRRL